MKRKKKKEYDVTTLCCVHCGAELLWDTIKFSNGTEQKSLHWECPKCGKPGINICTVGSK